jgi:hypothetical protein
MSTAAVPAVPAVAQPVAWLPFEELVDAHWRWRSDPSTEPDYRAKLERFEREYGQIVDSYWCEHLPSAVALTEQPQPWPRTSVLGFHRVSDWATQNEPKVAELLHLCDELTIKIAKILRGPTRGIAMQLVVAAATHVLSLVDQPAEHRRTTDRKDALRFETTQLHDARRYYEEVGLRQAQLVYLAGMIVGTALVGAVAALVWLATGRDFSNRVLLCLALGAAGATLSVMQRMGSRDHKFELDYELGRAPLVVFGLFRPLLGGAFGLVFYGAAASSLVNLQLESGRSGTTALYGLLAFTSGWSERFAKDVLDSAEQTVGAAVQTRRKAHEPAPGAAPALGAGGAP